MSREEFIQQYVLNAIRSGQFDPFKGSDYIIDKALAAYKRIRFVDHKASLEDL